MATDDVRPVNGRCPGCGLETLRLGPDGAVRCASSRCYRPDAAALILADGEPHHIVDLGRRSFTIRHPLIERIDDDLFTCTLHDHLSKLRTPPAEPGRYRARLVADDWTWEAIA